MHRRFTGGFRRQKSGVYTVVLYLSFGPTLNKHILYSCTGTFGMGFDAPIHTLVPVRFTTRQSFETRTLQKNVVPGCIRLQHWTLELESYIHIYACSPRKIICRVWLTPGSAKESHRGPSLFRVN